MSKTQSKIHETIAEIKKLRSIEKHFASTNEQLQQAYNDLDKTEDLLISELKDVEKLEKMSVKSLFYNVLGSKEKQLEKERQEYLQASLKHKELKKSIEVLEYEHKIISSKVQEISGLEADLEKLKKNRMQEIMVTNSKQRIKITGIHKQMDENRAVAEELHQAHQAGKAALNALSVVLKHLKDAVKWGNWDMMNDGSYYGQMKHGAMDRAVHAAQQAQHSLRIFDRELVDVNIEQTQLNINLSGFSKFMDIFFDNIISDWVVQQKIKNAYNSVDATYDKIKRYIGVIEKELSTLDQHMRQLSNAIDDILEE